MKNSIAATEVTVTGRKSVLWESVLVSPPKKIKMTSKEQRFNLEHSSNYYPEQKANVFSDAYPDAWHRNRKVWWQVWNYRTWVQWRSGPMWPWYYIEFFFNVISEVESALTTWKNGLPLPHVFLYFSWQQDILSKNTLWKYYHCQTMHQRTDDLKNSEEMLI